MDGARRAAAARLRPYVAWYSGYRQQGLPPGFHRGLPSPHLTLILTLDDPLMIAAHPDPAQEPGHYRALIAGLHSCPALIRHEGYQSGVQVALHPLGARALLGLPAGELAGADVDLDQVLGHRSALLRERLLAAPTWDDRFDALDAALADLVDPDRSLPPELHRAWQLLRADGGSIGVRRLAREVGWGERHLLHRFRQEIGLSPKQAARVVRFDRTRVRLLKRVTAGRPAELADLAVGAGYYDQAHLAREFRELAGCSPSAFLAEELRYVQAEYLPDDEDWQP
ncbi:MAG TPA: helix-turn-helix domain-containing protein [Kineosporiaceae bacterium]|nr:helix-turn-helix domain-containing protein [Kineosporiaceae bacterium]